MDEVAADLLPEEVLTEIDQLLSPGNPLSKDVRDLAGILDFSVEEIRYICGKQCAFKYMLDQWCKREGDTATLERLNEALRKMKRPDIAVIVDEAVKEVKEASYHKLHQLVQQRNHRRDRSDSGLIQLDEEKYQADAHPYADSKNNISHDKPVVGTKADVEDDKPPTVFIVYFPESEKHLEQVKDLVAILRSYRIDARTDMFETQVAARNRQFYVLARLQKSDYVIILCSSSMKLAEELLPKKPNISKISDKMKELLFVMSQIITDIYHGKKKTTKYIPVLLPKCIDEDVPRFLSSQKQYVIPEEYDALIRRIFRIETYTLPQLKDSNKHVFKPRSSAHVC